MCFFSPIQCAGALVMCDDQEGQLDPSRVLIAANPDGGKLTRWGHVGLLALG